MMFNTTEKLFTSYWNSEGSDQLHIHTPSVTSDIGQYCLIRHVCLYTVLGFNDTSTLVGHFVSSPREREKRDRRDSRSDESEGQGRKRNRNESEETEEIKTSPSTLTCYKDSKPCPTVSQFPQDPVVQN